MLTLLVNRAEQFLSGKKVSMAVILLAITGRVIQLVYFFNIRVDGMYQHLATLNFVTGHGISTGQVFHDNLSATVYEPLINWPPGYSILLSPFYLLFNNNYIAAGLTLDILAAITFIIVSRKILKLFDIPIYLKNIYTLTTGFFIYFFYFIASSDAVAISFFITGLYFSLSLIKTEQFFAKKTAALTISFIICAAIKYLFFPVAIIVPFFFIVKGFADKKIQLKKAGLYSFVIMVLVLGALLIYQKSISGTAAYISQPERGFFPEHVLSAYPFIPAAFINPESISLILHQEQTEKSFVYHIFQWIHAILFLGAVAFMSWRIYKYGFKKLSLKNDFFYLFFFISLTITLLLLLLSLWVAKEEILPGYFWTYIEDPRYYGLPVVLIHLSVFIFSRHLRMPATRLKYLFVFSILLLLPEMFRGVLFDINRIVNIKKEEYSWQYENRFQKYAATILKKEKQPGEKAVVTGSAYYMTNRVGLWSNIPVLDDASKINNLTSLNTKAPVLLLVILNEKDSAASQPFLSANSKAIGQYGKYNFYTVHIVPQ